MAKAKKSARQAIPKEAEETSIMGRPKAEINKESFEALMEIPFISCESAAGVFGVCKETIVRFVKREYGITFAELKEQKKENLRVKLAAKQYQTAMKGNAVMQIWLGKQYLGQSDKQEIKAEINNGLADQMAKARERAKKNEM